MARNVAYHRRRRAFKAATGKTPEAFVQAYEAGKIVRSPETVRFWLEGSQLFSTRHRDTNARDRLERQKRRVAKDREATST